jgi:hypothetical protein
MARTLTVIAVATTIALLVGATAADALAARAQLACNFSGGAAASLSSQPPLRLLVDNYAARSETRAVQDRDPQSWLLQLTLPLSGSDAAARTADGVVCAARFAWRGFVAPFWLTRTLDQSRAGQPNALPLIERIDAGELDYFASCGTSAERIATSPLRITVSDVRTTGASWSTTSNATMPVESGCNLADLSDITQFVRVVVVTASGAELIETLSAAAADSSKRTLTWVASGGDVGCPLYIGVAVDPAVCPGTVTMLGTATISLRLQLEVQTSAAMVWYMWVPSLVCVVCGIALLVAYRFASSSDPLPLLPRPELAETSPLLALAQTCLIAGSVASAIGLSVVIAIDQNAPMLGGTPRATVLMGSLYAIAIFALLFSARSAAAREHPRLRSGAVFQLAWLRLVARSLALGATCAAWYRGFFAVAIVYVALQFAVEIGFWASVSTTFAASHEPLRYGTAGDQMLVLSAVAIVGLHLPFIGVIASAASRVYCITEMSERHRVAPKPERPAAPTDTAVTSTKADDAAGSPRAGAKPGSRGRGAAAAAAVADDDDASPNGGAEGDGDDEALGDEATALQRFPVAHTAALAMAFDGLLVLRWWSLVLESLAMPVLSCIVAYAHPPFGTVAVAHAFVAAVLLAFSFGAVASARPPGVPPGAVAVGSLFSGDTRATAAAATGCALGTINYGDDGDADAAAAGGGAGAEAAADEFRADEDDGSGARAASARMRRQRSLPRESPATPERRPAGGAANAAAVGGGGGAWPGAGSAAGASRGATWPNAARLTSSASPSSLGTNPYAQPPGLQPVANTRVFASAGSATTATATSRAPAAGPDRRPTSPGQGPRQFTFLYDEQQQQQQQPQAPGGGSALVRGAPAPAAAAASTAAQKPQPPPTTMNIHEALGVRAPQGRGVAGRGSPPRLPAPRAGVPSSSGGGLDVVDRIRALTSMSAAGNEQFRE